MTDAFDHGAQLGTLWRDGLVLADAASRVGLHTPVASCPGWTVADLLWHTGEVHEFWRTVVTERWEDPSAYVEPDRPADHELVGWFRTGVQRTVEVLTAADPAEPVWTWAPGGTNAAWVVRRMVHETAVHRWDADGEPLDPELAVDGVAEFLEHFTGRTVAGALPLGGTAHLHATDAEGEWMVSEPSPDGPLEFVAQHAKGDAAVRGTASDLVLLLWRRVSLDDPGRFEIFGEPEVARRLVARHDLS